MSNPQGPQTPSGRPPQGRGAPGAMTMAMAAVGPRPTTGPKVLRIGVIQGDRMVEERVVRSRETVTVGSSERNHFVIAGLPPTFDLFLLQGNDYILNFTDEMRGKVGLSGGVQELSQLRATNAARNAGSFWQIKLNDQSRGRVTIPGSGGNSDTTLLFQFIDPPPVQPRPQLPAAVMQGLTANLDWLFTAFVVFSFMSHFGFVIFLENADWPVPPSLATLPPDILEFMVEPEEPPPEVPVEEGPAEEVEESEEVAEASTESSSSSSSDTPTSGEAREAADSDARMAAEDAAAAAENLLIGALGGENGALADVLAGGAVTSSAADVLATADGVGVADGSAGALRDRSGGGRVGGATDGLGGLARAGEGRAGAARTEGGALAETAPRGRFRASADDADESGAGSFDMQAVVRMINTRRAAITRCYETQLRSNPTLAGRVRVSMTIQESGSVTNVRAVENTTNSEEVASCVVRVVQGFRFNPGPTDGSVTYAFPFVFEPAG
jgi:TonB family protein